MILKITETNGKSTNFAYGSKFYHELNSQLQMACKYLHQSQDDKLPPCGLTMKDGTTVDVVRKSNPVLSQDVFPTDSSKIAHKLKFNFHSDAGHGWLAVKLNLIRELGLATEISQYSYMQGKTAYLEEDCDAPKFIKAFKERFGIEPQIVDLEQKRDRSVIRSMKRFEMEG